ncbi:hypothetical protein PproGo58_41850 [Pseudomonas protegens]|nr:hypothetical protein PproGo58_41850 [Pseudomonas protegens]
MRTPQSLTSKVHILGPGQVPTQRQLAAKRKHDCAGRKQHKPSPIGAGLVGDALET